MEGMAWCYLWKDNEAKPMSARARAFTVFRSTMKLMRIQERKVDEYSRIEVILPNVEAL